MDLAIVHVTCRERRLSDNNILYPLMKGSDHFSSQQIFELERSYIIDGKWGKSFLLFSKIHATGTQNSHLGVFPKRTSLSKVSETVSLHLISGPSKMLAQVAAQSTAFTSPAAQ